MNQPELLLLDAGNTLVYLDHEVLAGVASEAGLLVSPDALRVAEGVAKRRYEASMRQGVSHAAVFASGLAAEHAVLQAWLRPGDQVIIPLDVYGGTYRLLTKVFQPLGCIVRQIDVADEAALRTALSDRTRLVWIESPTNPRLLVYDIAAIAVAAHARGALVVVDNTFATPLFQQPFQLGADIVVHSVTKYLAGHSDLVQGAVDDLLGERLLAVLHHLVDHLRDQLAVVDGVRLDRPDLDLGTPGHQLPRLAPYLERPCLRSETPDVSSAARITL